MYNLPKEKEEIMSFEYKIYYDENIKNLRNSFTDEENEKFVFENFNNMKELISKIIESHLENFTNFSKRKKTLGKYKTCDLIFNRNEDYEISHKEKKYIVNFYCDFDFVKYTENKDEHSLFYSNEASFFIRKKPELHDFFNNATISIIIKSFPIHLKNNTLIKENSVYMNPNILEKINFFRKNKYMPLNISEQIAIIHKKNFINYKKEDEEKCFAKIYESYLMTNNFKEKFFSMKFFDIKSFKLKNQSKKKSSERCFEIIRYGRPDNPTALNFISEKFELEQLGNIFKNYISYDLFSCENLNDEEIFMLMNLE